MPLSDSAWLLAIVAASCCALLASAAQPADPAAPPVPPPVMKAARIDQDFKLDGTLANAAWKKAEPVRIERRLHDAAPRPELSTTARCLWSANYLYLAFECPFTKLTVFDPPSPTERLGLWDRDVVEAFIGSDLERITRYAEFEVAPTNERLDVKLDLPDKDFPWDSRFESAVTINEKTHIWRAELRIPLRALAGQPPVAGTRWRLNLYRHDRAGDVFLAWNPTLTPSAHTPARFGLLEFAD